MSSMNAILFSASWIVLAKILYVSIAELHSFLKLPASNLDLLLIVALCKHFVWPFSLCSVYWHLTLIEPFACLGWISQCLSHIKTVLCPTAFLGFSFAFFYVSLLSWVANNIVNISVRRVFISVQHQRWSEQRHCGGNEDGQSQWGGRPSQ